MKPLKGLMVRFLFYYSFFNSIQKIESNKIVPWDALEIDPQRTHWIYDPSWIKNPGQGTRLHPHPWPIPTYLNGYIEFYLNEIRPILTKNNSSTSALWLTTKGTFLFSFSLF